MSSAPDGDWVESGADQGSLQLLPWLAQMRNTAPVSSDRGMYQVFGYDAARQVLSDHEHFGSDLSALMPGMTSFTRGKLTMTDPPDHRRLRRLIGSAFTPRRIAELQPQIDSLAAELLPDRGVSVDFMTTVGGPLPMLVIARLLGLPDAKLPAFAGWADRLISLQVDDPSDPELPIKVDRELHAMDDLFGTYCEQRRRTGSTADLLGQLINVEMDGERLSADEVLQNAALLLLAGHITTTLLLGNLVVELAANPAAFAGLRDGSVAVRDVIEETLRIRPPFVQASRVSRAGAVIDGVTIEPGRFVQVWILSANRDGAVFTEPDDFRPGRNANPDALTFGHGIHFCIGAALARMESDAVLKVMMDRYQVIDLDGATVTYYPVGVLGPKRLGVQFG